MTENDVYPDPYFGSNLKSIPGYREGRWLSMSKDSPFYPTWWYRKSFVVSKELKGKKMVLHLDGINYKANVWLNGRKIADSSKVIGMFRRFEFDVDKFVRIGEENVYNFDLDEVYSKSANVSVAADWKTEAFKIDFPDKLGKIYFLSLKLHNSALEEISDNFYWLSTTPDIQGSKEEVRTDKGWGVLKANPKSFADFTSLNNLPKVKIDASYDVEKNGTESIVKVKLINVGSHLALQVHLALIKGEGGDEISPTYWDDNYINLLPGESRTISARYLNDDLDNSKLYLKIDGWNIEPTFKKDIVSQID